MDLKLRQSIFFISNIQVVVYHWVHLLIEINSISPVTNIVQQYILV